MIRPVTFEQRLRLHVQQQGLAGKCSVVKRADGPVTCVAPAGLSDDECARLLAAWQASLGRVC